MSATKGAATRELPSGKLPSLWGMSGRCPFSDTAIMICTSPHSSSETWQKLRLASTHSVHPAQGLYACERRRGFAQARQVLHACQ